jgi:uncharacterized membrane protein
MTWHDEHRRTLSRGELAADVMRNGMGSWRFVTAFILAMAVWAVINLLTDGWDPYPFILLNLFLSMIAGLQGSILLIAAKRQDAVAAALARHDYETNLTAKREIDELLSITRAQLEILTELRAERDAERAARSQSSER